jgi:hypothetical protein
MATNTRTAGLRRLAGKDDGRMYGMSDAGYQGTLRQLTVAQEAANKSTQHSTNRLTSASWTVRTLP